VSTLKVNNLTDLGDDPIVTDGALIGAGKILQVVSTTKTNTFTLASGSFTDITGFSATITPSSASNKVLVMVSMGGVVDVSAGSVSAKLIRDTTDLALGDAAGGYIQTTFGGYEAGINQITYPITYLDSPATTSATTYKIAIKVSVHPGGGSMTFILNQGGLSSGGVTYGDLSRGSSTITLMEVAG
jgi:hypothetical protein